MSRALARSKRIKHDAYYTPDLLADAIVERLAGDFRSFRAAFRFFEPSVGGGAFARALRKVCPKAEVAGIDVNESAVGRWACDPLLGFHGDFLQMNPDAANAARLAGWIVGNPPYREAEAHVRHALGLPAQGVAFLLRLGFLEGACRVPFWQEHPPSDVYVIQQRPSFTGGGTDGAAYGVFVWTAERHTSQPARLHHLSWPGNAAEAARRAA